MSNWHENLVPETVLIRAILAGMEAESTRLVRGLIPLYRLDEPEGQQDAEQDSTEKEDPQNP